MSMVQLKSSHNKRLFKYILIHQNLGSIENTAKIHALKKMGMGKAGLPAMWDGDRQV